jgi:hypothetical protein
MPSFALVGVWIFFTFFHVAESLASEEERRDLDPCILSSGSRCFVALGTSWNERVDNATFGVEIRERVHFLFGYTTVFLSLSLCLSLSFS